MPETANINNIIVVLYQIRQEKEAINQAEDKPVSCYDLAKDYIGCIEGLAKRGLTRHYSVNELEEDINTAKNC
ncbi:MAG: hypothetical protein KAI83_17330 [Thiomargarita sp.]|nr:hypothetical protein [Thiomargarita sp.]